MAGLQLLFPVSPSQELAGHSISPSLPLLPLSLCSLGSRDERNPPVSKFWTNMEGGWFFWRRESKLVFGLALGDSKWLFHRAGRWLLALDSSPCTGLFGASFRPAGSAESLSPSPMQVLHRSLHMLLSSKEPDPSELPSRNRKGNLYRCQVLGSDASG
jgi:hypothetical protein